MALAHAKPVEGFAPDAYCYRCISPLPLYTRSLSGHTTAGSERMQHVIYGTHVCEAFGLRYGAYTVREQVFAVSLQGGGCGRGHNGMAGQIAQIELGLTIYRSRVYLSYSSLATLEATSRYDRLPPKRPDISKVTFSKTPMLSRRESGISISLRPISMKTLQPFTDRPCWTRRNT